MPFQYHIQNNFSCSDECAKETEKVKLAKNVVLNYMQKGVQKIYRQNTAKIYFYPFFWHFLGKGTIKNPISFDY